MIVEIALATNTAPRDWFDEDDETIATALVVLYEQAERLRNR